MATKLQASHPLRVGPQATFKPEITAVHARLAAQKEGLQRLARPANWTVHLHRTDRSPQTVLLSLYLAMADMGRLNLA